MTPDPTTVLKNSVIYRLVEQLREWAQGSVVVKLLNDERVLVGLLGGFLLVSLIRVLSSSLHVTVQFLSFVLLFVVLVALTWGYTKPLTNE